MIKQGNDYAILENGIWWFAFTDSAGKLPTVGVPDGSLAWDNSSQALLAFSSGSWSAATPTFGNVIAATLAASGAATLTSTLAVTGLSTLTGGAVLAADFKLNVEDASASGAVVSKGGIVVITKATAAALTLADPTATTDDGKVLQVITATAAAHTLDNSAGSGFNDGGGASDVGTFAAAIGNSITLVAYQGVWYVLNNVGVTLG